MSFLIFSLLFSQTPFSPGFSINGTESEGRQIIFTFDDGPDYRTTPLLLDYLLEEDIKVIFFINGIKIGGRLASAVRNRQVLKIMHERGHWIGNHTYSHPMMDKVSPATQKKQIMQNHRAIEKLLGLKMFLYRPPFGLMTGYSRTLLKDEGYAIIMWNLESHDPFQRHVLKNWRNVLRDIALYQGGIILMHDTNSWSLESVPRIVKTVRMANCENIDRNDPIYEFGDVSHFYSKKAGKWKEPSLEMVKKGLQNRKKSEDWCRNIQSKEL
ncbi:polysaccharide deacetylase family protein [Myxococcota bacterium]|nr:polysaccharide deacetylase family protein [Myxococcota bacterium]MBU1381042.1 polysaccharide deacetylase family protein [Myxococcota bacterium]MBU1495421.1 polysaccharide deacetylase family protein [Myxococcota bacterium]